VLGPGFGEFYPFNQYCIGIDFLSFMLSAIVVMLHPIRSYFPHFYQTIENSCIQNLCLVTPVEPFDKSILNTFGRLDVSDFDSLFITPIRENRTSELSTLSVRIALCFPLSFYNPFQQIGYMHRSAGKPDFNPN